MKPTAILLLHCPDQQGIISEVTRFITDNQGNIVYLDQYVDKQDGMFFMRIEPLVILHSVSSVYLDIYRVYEGQKSNKSIDDIASDFDYGSRKFILNKTILKLKNFNIRKLSDSFSILLNCDKALKSFSGNERLCLEKMTVDLFNVLWGNT